MAICHFFLEGRCRFGDRCWNEHPRGGRRQEQSRYNYQQPPAASKPWTSSNQRYVQPSSFSKSTTWSRDNSQTSAAPRSDTNDNRSGQYSSGSSTGLFSSQNRFSTLPSQDHSREAQSDKDGNLFEDIKRDLDVWESSGQWIFSAYCVKDAINLTEFTDISQEELRLEYYTARDSGNMQNYVNSVQQLAIQWKQRIHAIKNTNISSQAALINKLTKPATSSAPTFGGQQSSAFSSTNSSTGNAAQSAINFNFKMDSSCTTPITGPVSSFPHASGFVNKPATGFGNAATGSAASFTFAATSASDGASSGFGNAQAATASTFSFASAPSAVASGFAAATTVLPANTSSTATNVFGGTTATGFGQSATPAFGGAPSTSGFGTLAGNTVTSGFGASATPAFGGAPSTSGFGTLAGNTVTSGFGASATPAFGGAPSTSGFGTVAGNTVTSGFGAKTSAVSDLFRTGAANSTTNVPFGQTSSVTTTTGAGSGNPLFTPRSELSAKELSQFEASRFTIGNVPLRPPPSNLLMI